MSKTYRNMIRGRLRAAQKKFKANDEYHEVVWRRYYSYKKPSGLGLRCFDPANREIHWHQVRQVKPSYQDKEPWDLLSYKEQGCVFRGYSRNPSWWNLLYGTAPDRRHTRDQLSLYKGFRIPDYDIEDKFYGRRIHCDYYW